MIATSESTAEQPSINLGTTERKVSLAAGAALALIALKKPVSLRALVLGALAVSLIKRGATGHCDLYERLGLCEDGRESSTDPKEYYRKGIHIDEAVTIMKSPSDVYSFWRDLENLPKFMQHVKSVKKIDGERSHWQVRGPMNFNVDWDAQIINDEPGALIAWKTTGHSEIDHAGTVRFVPLASGDGCEVHVTMDYIPPAGAIGHYLSKLFLEDPGTQTRRDLRQLKQLLEAGELATNNEGRPRGTV